MRILFIGSGHSAICGGQARVAYYTIQELTRAGHEVYNLGFAYDARVTTPGEVELCPGSAITVDGLEAAVAATEKFKPDVAILSHDCWLFYWLPEYRAKFPDVKIVGWFTIDAHPLHYSWLPIFRATDLLCVPSMFGKKVLYKDFPERSVMYLPYGVNHTDFYYPAEGKSKAKLSFAEAYKIPVQDRCVFVFAGMNQGKKNVGAMVDAYRLLHQRYPDIAVILALKHVSVQHGGYHGVGEYDFHQILSEARDPGLYLIDSVLGNDALGDLYRAADFYLYPSQGESPGLQMSEAALCGTPALYTDYSGLPEEATWPEYAITDFSFMRGVFSCFRALVSPESLATAMERAYLDWKSGALELAREHRRGAVTAKFSSRTWMQSTRDLLDAVEALQRGAALVERAVERIDYVKPGSVPGPVEVSLT